MDNNSNIKRIINKVKFLQKKLEKYYIINKISRCGVWFVDIPRTSSSSIKVELKNKYGYPYGKSNLLEKDFASISYFQDHLQASQVQELLGKKTWEKIFTFTVVRNPWDRMLSIYYYRIKKKQINPELTFKDYLKLYIEESNESILKHPHLGKNILNMIDYISDQEGNIIVDYIVKYENRNEDLEYVRKKINFSELGQLCLQSASPKSIDYKQYYDPQSIEIVASLFEKDIRELKYNFN